MNLDFIPCAKAGHPGVDQWDSLINLVAPQYHVPPNLVKAHILYESGGDAKVVSFDGGCGLCQITSGVEHVDGAWLYDGQNILDPHYNVETACKRFIAPNMAAFPDNLQAIIAAYNAGIGAVRQALDEGREVSSVTYDPTYVPHVMHAYVWFCERAHGKPTT